MYTVKKVLRASNLQTYLNSLTDDVVAILVDGDTYTVINKEAA